MRRHLTIAVLTALALGGGVTATASADIAPRSITAEQCQDAGGRVITILTRGACVGGELHGKSVNG